MPSSALPLPPPILSKTATVVNGISACAATREDTDLIMESAMVGDIQEDEEGIANGWEYERMVESAFFAGSGLWRRSRYMDWNERLSVSFRSYPKFVRGRVGWGLTCVLS